MFSYQLHWHLSTINVAIPLWEKEKKWTKEHTFIVSLVSETGFWLLILAFFLVPCPASSEFCDSHLRLLFTMMEKSPLPVVRSNLIIAAGDLAIRFPNQVEPWTTHLYAR